MISPVPPPPPISVKVVVWPLQIVVVPAVADVGLEETLLTVIVTVAHVELEEHGAVVSYLP